MSYLTSIHIHNLDLVIVARRLIQKFTNVFCKGVNTELNAFKLGVGKGCQRFSTLAILQMFNYVSVCVCIVTYQYSC